MPLDTALLQSPTPRRRVAIRDIGCGTGYTASHNVPIREDDDFGFLTIHFLYKHMQHTESVLVLVPRRD
jgi:hypothetical protein